MICMATESQPPDRRKGAAAASESPLRDPYEVLGVWPDPDLMANLAQIGPHPPEPGTSRWFFWRKRRNRA